ncbi:MAG: hypothetical protein R3B39_02320 [Candidatus Paceibacterota bacterium]
MLEKNFLEKKDNSDLEAKRVIEYYFRPRLTHDLSQDMTENNQFDLDNFRASHNDWTPDENYYFSVPKKGEDKKFSGVEGLNVGWKIHLNSSPENVNTIFEYLKNNKYLFKYLAGGEPVDGKVFTLYIGDHSLTKKLSKEISVDLSTYLARPIDHTEIEFDRGVVGRFVGPKQNGFHQYGTCGFSLLNADMANNIYDKKEDNLDSEIRAFNILKNLYGERFFEIKD